MNRKVGIINYGSGNLASVYNAVNHLGFNPIFIAKPEDIKKFSIALM